MSKSPQSSPRAAGSSPETKRRKTRTRRVRFDSMANLTHIIEKIPLVYKHEVFYCPQELKRLRKADIHWNIQAQKCARSGSIENDHQTWRGLEDIRDDCCKREKSEWHAQMVLREISRQKEAKGYLDKEEIRLFSKAISKPDRLSAQRLADKDASAAGNAFAKSIAKRTSQNISRSFYWLKKNPTTSISHMAKKVAIAAC